MKDSIKSQAEMDDHIRDALLTSRHNFDEASAALSSLATAVRARDLFVTVASLLSFAPATMLTEMSHGDGPAKTELLAFLLYPHFGASDKAPTGLHTHSCIQLLQKAFTARVQMGMFDDFERRRTDPLEHLRRQIFSHAEVVRGSAYPEQTKQEISSIQSRFDTFFLKSVGISPSRSVAILDSILETLEQRLNEALPTAIERAEAFEQVWKAARRRRESSLPESLRTSLVSCPNKKMARYLGYLQGMTETLPAMLPLSHTDLSSLSPSPTPDEWIALTNLIGMTAQTRAKIQTPCEIQFHPLYFVGEGQAFLLGLSHTLDALWLAFDNAARQDPSFFTGRYSAAKARWLEDKVYECLLRMFPPRSVFRNLSYPDVTKPGSATAEVDFLVYWPPFLVIVEAKACQFKEASRLGDLYRLRSDLKDNIEDSFVQAKRTLRYIESTGAPEFVEVSTGRRLTFSADQVRKSFLLSISQHYLAGLATHPSDLRALGLFRESEFPFAACIADLEIISRFAEGPDVFLHYLERRVDILHQPVEVMGDELDMFGAYLETRLQQERLFQHNGKPLDGIALTGFSKKFDDWMMHERGELDTSPDIRLDIPTVIKDILRVLRADPNHESARWISFALLTFSDRLLEGIARAIEEIRGSQLIPGMFRRVTFAEADTAISIVASIDQPVRLLRERTELRTLLEKYRRRALKSIGLGLQVNRPDHVIDCALWIEGPWEHDLTMERALEEEPAPQIADGQALPGRNAPCFCGSGKKFKKCCLRKLGN